MMAHTLIVVILAVIVGINGSERKGVSWADTEPNLSPTTELDTTKWSPFIGPTKPAIKKSLRVAPKSNIEDYIDELSKTSIDASELPKSVQGLIDQCFELNDKYEEGGYKNVKLAREFVAAHTTLSSLVSAIRLITSEQHAPRYNQELFQHILELMEAYDLEISFAPSCKMSHNSILEDANKVHENAYKVFEDENRIAKSNEMLKKILKKTPSEVVDDGALNFIIAKLEQAKSGPTDEQWPYLEATQVADKVFTHTLANKLEILQGRVKALASKSAMEMNCYHESKMKKSLMHAAINLLSAIDIVRDIVRDKHEDIGKRVTTVDEAIKNLRDLKAVNRGIEAFIEEVKNSTGQLESSTNRKDNKNSQKTKRNYLKSLLKSLLKKLRGSGSA